MVPSPVFVFVDAYTSRGCLIMNGGLVILVPMVISGIAHREWRLQCLCVDGGFIVNDNLNMFAPEVACIRLLTDFVTAQSIQFHFGL